MVTPRIVDRRTLPASAAWDPVLPADRDVPEAPVIAWTHGDDYIGRDADLDAVRAEAQGYVDTLDADYEALDEHVIAYNQCELLLHPEFRATMQGGLPILLIGAPRRGRLLVGGIGGGLASMEAFVAQVSREYEAAPPAARVSGLALGVSDGVVTCVLDHYGLHAVRALRDTV